MFAVGRPRSVAGLLTLAAFLFGATHVPPTGPLGATCFFVAVVLLEFGLAKAPATHLSSLARTAEVERSR
jgi:hypothetical protein